MFSRSQQRCWELLICGAFLSGACQSNEQPASESAGAVFDTSTLPPVVARVDSHEITREELVSRAESALRERPEDEVDLQFYRNVLQDLISSELFYQESLARGFAISDTELDQRIATIQERFPSRREFEDTLAEQGLTVAEMRTNLARDIAISRFLDKTVISQIRVTEEEAREYFEENKEQIRTDDQLRVRHILIRLGENAARPELERAQGRLEEIRAEISAGGDFGELARKYSQDPGSAPLGGDLNWISRGAMVPEFERVAYALQEDEISPVIRSRFGLHILQVIDRRPGPQVSYEEGKEQLLDFLRERKIENQLGRLASELRDKAEVEVYI